MYRARREALPHIPQTLDEWGKLLDEQKEKFGLLEGEEFFKTTIGEENSRMLVFVNPKLSHLLHDANQLHCDGTFKCVPRIPKTRQLFTIMGNAFDHVSKEIVDFQ